jgi:hypothetical protein
VERQREDDHLAFRMLPEWTCGIADHEVVRNSGYIMWKFAHEFRYFVIYFSNENSAKHKQAGLNVVTKRDSNIGSYLRRAPSFFTWILLMFGLR